MTTSQPAILTKYVVYKNYWTFINIPENIGSI